MDNLSRFPLRWLGVYLVLWFMPSPLGELPWVGEYLSGPVGAAKEKGALWFASLWGVHPAVESSGGSDRTIAYYEVGLLLVVSFLVAAIVTATRRMNAARDRRMFDWLCRYLRLMLACTMMLYGLCKVFPLQFHMPGPRVLTMHVGELEPWEVMWLFMGVSLPYTIFAGVAEIIGGSLLMWKRTSLFGALILLIVMGNVALMDLCYNVDMKVFALHLVLAIIVVLAPEAPRFLRALLATTEPEAQRGSGWLHRVGVIAPFAIFLVVSAQLLHWAWTTTRAEPMPHPLQGIWTVQPAADGGKCIAPASLHTVAIQRGSLTTIGHDHARTLYKLDPEKQHADQLTLLDAKSNAPVGSLRASATGQRELLLSGELAGEPLQLALQRSADTRLVSTPFRWAHDQPPQPR